MSYLDLFYLSLFGPLLAFVDQVTICCAFAVVAFAFIVLRRWLVRV